MLLRAIDIVHFPVLEGHFSPSYLLDDCNCICLTSPYLVTKATAMDWAD